MPNFEKDDKLEPKITQPPKPKLPTWYGVYTPGNPLRGPSLPSAFNSMVTPRTSVTNGQLPGSAMVQPDRPAPQYRPLSGTEDYRGIAATQWAETFKSAINGGSLPLQITQGEATPMSRYITGSDQGTADFLYENGYRWDEQTASWLRVAQPTTATATGGGSRYGRGGGGRGSYGSPFTLGLINWRI